MHRGKQFVVFVVLIQTVLLLAHYFLFKTWTFSSSGENVRGVAAARAAFAILSFTFVVASILAFRFTNPAVRAFYHAAAVWLGMLTFLAVAAVGTWLAFAIAAVFRFPFDFHAVAEWLFGAALLVGILGVLNASWTRITHITVRLANLPDTWRGRTAALISDVHLGHVRNRHFLRRMVRKILREEPDAVFIAGDLYDGTAIDARQAAEPLNKLTAPHGVFFVAGNHEQFGDDSRYLDAVSAAGVRVLTNEKVEVDGLQIVGVPYNVATGDSALASVLKSLSLDRDRASILLTHAPDRPEVAEAAGFSLQLSGHTHLGQFIPWSWMARRAYRQFVYGLSRIGQMQVFTSSGAGTWGPPLRLGSNPEIVMLKFE